MPVFDIANILVAFQIVYVKILCIFTTILLGPWTGIQIYLYSNHPPGIWNNQNNYHTKSDQKINIH